MNLRCLISLSTTRTLTTDGTWVGEDISLSTVDDNEERKKANESMGFSILVGNYFVFSSMFLFL